MFLPAVVKKPPFSRSFHDLGPSRSSAIPSSLGPFPLPLFPFTYLKNVRVSLFPFFLMWSLVYGVAPISAGRPPVDHVDSPVLHCTMYLSLMRYIYCKPVSPHVDRPLLFPDASICPSTFPLLSLHGSLRPGRHRAQSCESKFFSRNLSLFDRCKNLRSPPPYSASVFVPQPICFEPRFFRPAFFLIVCQLSCTSLRGLVYLNRQDSIF